MSGSSARYFHVDTDSRLGPGFDFPRRPWPTGFGAETRQCFEQRFPGGLSEWGASYLLDAGGERLIFDEEIARQLQITDPEEIGRAIRRARQRIIELFWEFSRREFAPDKPSRLQALFGYDELDVARDFRTDRCRNPNAPIWVVEAEYAFEADAAWLQLSVPIPGLIAYAKAYWNGARYPQAPLPIDREFLLSGRVVAIERVD